MVLAAAGPFPAGGQLYPCDQRLTKEQALAMRKFLSGLNFLSGGDFEASKNKFLKAGEIYGAQGGSRLVPCEEQLRCGRFNSGHYMKMPLEYYPDLWALFSVSSPERSNASGDEVELLKKTLERAFEDWRIKHKVSDGWPAECSTPPSPVHEELSCPKLEVDAFCGAVQNQGVKDKCKKSVCGALE